LGVRPGGAPRARPVSASTASAVSTITWIEIVIRTARRRGQAGGEGLGSWWALQFWAPLGASAKALLRLRSCGARPEPQDPLPSGARLFLTGSRRVSLSASRVTMKAARAAATNAMLPMKRLMAVVPVCGSTTPPSGPALRPAEPHIRSPRKRLTPKFLIPEVIGLGRAGPISHEAVCSF
jgi:hypothetical protein